MPECRYDAVSRDSHLKSIGKTAFGYEILPEDSIHSMRRIVWLVELLNLSLLSIDVVGFNEPFRLYIFLYIFVVVVVIRC